MCMTDIYTALVVFGVIRKWTTDRQYGRFGYGVRIMCINMVMAT